MTATAPTRRIRVHIENRSASPEVFRITPEKFARACERHPEVRDWVEPSFGEDAAEFERAMRDANVLVGFRIPTDARLGKAPHLELIQLTGAGLDHLLPLDWLPAHVALTTASGAHAVKVGEYAAMSLLMLNARMPHYIAAQASARWAPSFTTALSGKTVLVVGVGHMGGAAAERAKGLGLRVLGVRPSREAHPAVDEMHGPEDLDGLLPRADFVLVAAPLTSRTRGLVGRRQIGLMRKGAGLVNIGRAGIVDYRALADALSEGRLGGAVLDVFDPEPLPADSYLWHTPGLVMTPHVSSDDEQEYIPRVLDVLFENVRRHRSGEPLVNRVDPAREY